MVAKVTAAVVLEVALEFKAFGILMINVGAGDIAFIGASLVR